MSSGQSGEPATSASARCSVALFHRDGNVWIPQEACVGPWSPETLHGGPVAALCVALAEALLPGESLVTTRLSLDLIRPIPLRPLDADARLIKSGRRVHLIEIAIRGQGREVAVARVQRTSMHPLSLPPLEGTGAEHQAAPESPHDFVAFDAQAAARPPAPFLRLATDLRMPSGTSLFGRGVKVAWLRVGAQLTPGVPLSNTAAVAAACDYTNALGAPAMPSQLGILFPNADLTMHLIRTPVSKWVRLSPNSAWLDHGIGHVCCQLCDEYGVLGTSAATLPLSEAKAPTA